MPIVEPKWIVVGVVFATAFLAMALVFVLGRKVYERHLDRIFEALHFLRHGPSTPDFRAVASMVDGFRAYVETRNDFLSIFVQFVLAILIVAFLIVLLIMEVVQADAALPLIAAVVAYVLGKGSAASSAAPNRQQRGE